jgi:hypothetical protein
MLFGVALILFTYSCSYLFNSSKSATMYFPVVNFMIGFMIPLINIIKNSTFKTILLKALEYFYPFYTLQNNL